MFDLINFNVGSGGFGKRYAATGTGGNRVGTRQVNLPRPADTDQTKFAKRIVKLFDVSGIDYYGVAAALWDVAPDSVKTHLYGMVDAMLEVAADKHRDDMDYTLVECQIGEQAWKLRNFLDEYGFLTPDP